MANTLSFPARMTIGEKYGPAMEITDQSEADAYFAACVDHAMRRQPEMSRQSIESQERMNLGYYAGYYGDETRARVERLFKCSHPVFGKVESEKGGAE